MAYVFRSVGTKAVDPSGNPLTCGMPAGFLAGDLLVMATGAATSAETLATPSGWARLSIDANAQNIKFFGRIAVGGDTAPAVNWSGTSGAFQQIAAFSGAAHTDLSTIVNASVDTQGTATTLLTGTVTPTADSCLIIQLNKKSKTVTSDGGGFNALGSLTQIDQNYPNGTDVGYYWGYVLQGAHAALSTGPQTFSGTTESTKYQSTSVALLSTVNQASIGGPRQWVAFDMACRLRCLQQGSLVVGNQRQTVANLRALALAQIASPSSPPWAKYSTAANMPKKILIWPNRVPGFVRPVAS